MTVSTTDSQIDYSSGGPSFPIPFKFLRDEDIQPVLTLADGSQVVLTQNVQYTLTGSGNEGGGTLTSAYAQTAINAGALLRIARNMQPTQETDLRNQGRYFAETHERVFDRLTMLIQQALTGVGNSLSLSRLKNRWDFKGLRGVNVGDPIDPKDVANKGYVDTSNAAQDTRIDALSAGLPGTNYAFPWSTTTTTGTKTLTPGFEFASATLYINGIAQTFGKSFAVSGNQIVLAQAVPSGTEIYAILGQYIVPGQAPAVINARDFGISGVDIGPALNRACEYASLIGGGIVKFDAGYWQTSVEIKIPPLVTVKGPGIDVGSIKAMDSLPVNQNVFTNSGNNRLSRSTFDYFLAVEDFTVDANWQGRDPAGTAPLNDQGCGVKFSSVRNGAIRRIKSMNAPLHCIDVCASVYLNDGNINNQPEGPSLDVVIEDCIGIDPQRDDAITTHNSGRIQISRCKSFFNGTPGDTQQGVEVDEGSWEVTVTDCYAKNFQKGFQVKGHETTIPARDVQFVRCVAEDCTYSFECSHLQVGTVLPAGQVYWARNAVFVDCVSINVKPSTVYAQAKDLSINGYIGTTVRNLTVYGTAGILAIDKGADHVHIKGVKFKDGSTSSGVGFGRIYIYAPNPAVPNGQTVTIEDVVGEAPMACPMIRATSSACRKRIRNITAYGSDPAIPMLAINVGSNDDIGDLYQSGYLCTLQPTGNTAYQFDNTLRLQPGLRYSMAGSAVPEGVVTAPLASVYQCTGNGNVYRKSTAASPFNTGWIAM